MSAPLDVCTEEEQRAVVRFLWSENVSGAEIHRRLQTQYGNNNCMSRRSVYEWIEKFKDGRTSVKHQEGAGRPRTSTGLENVDRAKDMILQNRRIKVEEVATDLEISHGSAHEIIHDVLGFRKVCARWVPKKLTDVHKTNRVNICQRHLNRHASEPEFMERVITGDETWIHHYEPESKRNSMTWKHPDSPVPKKFKTKPSVGEILLTVFRDCRGPLIEHYLERGSTVTSHSYCEMLRDDLRPAIRTKRRGLLSRGVILLHDNARPHSAARTIEALQQMKFEVMEHPPYSPDLAPSDFHLFGPLKEELRGRHFSSDQEVKDAVHQWLSSQPKSFFSEGINALVRRWTKCIERQGDYIEK